ncbi:MAG: NgoBV family restriction endonuclease, partial [Bacilli bacterium]
RNIIYNIRPTIWYSKNNTGFKNKEEFIRAIYLTLKEYKNKKFATEWITEMKKSYNNYYDKEIEVNIN